MTTTSSASTPDLDLDLEDLDKEARAIEAFGLNYRKVSLKRKEIDLKHSRTFNARSEDRVNEEIVLKYALLMERGTRFPRGTAFYDNARKVYIVISGVHRVSAHEAAGLNTPIDMFEIIVDPPGDPDTMERIADLGVTLNNTGPLGLSHAEALQAAIRAVHERGESIDAVAARWGLRDTDVDEAYEIWKLDRELLQLGLDPSVIARKTDKKHVLSLPSQGWMLEVQKLLTGFKDKKTGVPVMTGSQLADTARDLRAEKSDAGRQEIIRKARAVLAEGRKPRKSGSKATPNQVAQGHQPYFVFRRSMGALRGLSPSELAAARATSADAAKAFVAEINEMRAVLDAFEEAVQIRWQTR